MLTPKIDFQVIETYDPKVIVIADTSRWAAIKNDPSILEIKYEDHPIYAEYFKKESINVIDSLKLFDTWDKDLKDGSYKITLKGSPETHQKERYVYRTQNLITRIDYLFNNEKEDKEYIEKMYELFYIHESIKSHTRDGNIGKASKKYKLLKRMTEDLVREIDCKSC